MSKKSLPTLLSESELLAALEEVEKIPETKGDIKTQILEHYNDVVPFLSNYKIEPGETPVNKRILYRLYKTHYSKDPVSSLQFHHIVGQFLGYYYNLSGGFYKLNQDNFTIASHMYKEHNNKRIEKTKSNTYRRHFELFMQKQNVQPGNKWMEGYLIHEIYKDYCRQSGMSKPKLGRDNFHKFMKLFFKHRRISDSRAFWYMVNEETTTILNEERKCEIKARRSKKEI